MPFTPITATYFLGTAGLLGAIVSLGTVSYFTRRALLVGGHIIMMILLTLVGVFTDINQPYLVLVAMCLFIITM